MSELALQLIREAKNNKATKLNLGKCGLQELPDELFELSCLEELNIANAYWDLAQSKKIERTNKGADNLLFEIPNEIEKLTQLKTLRIGGWGVKWCIQDVKPLIKLKKLETLDLRNTRVDDLSFLTKFPNLTALTFSQNPHCRDFSILSKLPKLEALDLRHNNLSDTSIFEQLPQLRNLKISTNKITNLDFIYALPNLIALDVSYNKWIEDFSLIKRARKSFVKEKIKEFQLFISPKISIFRKFVIIYAF